MEKENKKMKKRNGKNKMEKKRIKLIGEKNEKKN